MVLCNNALAWGGVERQVVNTLKGLAERLPEPPKLLCVRLGQGADYDFYRSALANYRGEVRNTIDIAAARRQLAHVATDLEDRISEAISWMPMDVQDEILRFAGDFAVLKPSVVHVWQDALSISAGYAARLMGVPRILISSRNMAAERFDYHRPYMANAYCELAGCKEIIMLNNSEAGARDYGRWLGLPFDRYVVVRNGIDASAFSRPSDVAVEQFKASLGLPQSGRVIGSIFRFYPEKQPRPWIEAAHRIAVERPDSVFVIFGKGPLKNDLQSYARQHGFGDRLFLPGTIKDVALGLAIMDTFMLTSELEGTPNVILEASLAGIPVVATEAGGTAETIEVGRTGFLADTAEPNAIAELVIKVLDNRDWSARVGTEGPAFVQERFGLDRMLNELVELYDFRKVS